MSNEVATKNHAPCKGTERAEGGEFQADGSARKAKAYCNRTFVNVKIGAKSKAELHVEALAGC